MHQPKLALPINSNAAYEKRYSGYFTPNGAADPVIVVTGKVSVSAAHVSTGRWNLTLQERVGKILSARAWPIDDGVDVVENQVLAWDDATQVFQVRNRRAVNTPAALAVSDACDRICFEITVLTTVPPGNI